MQGVSNQSSLAPACFPAQDKEFWCSHALEELGSAHGSFRQTNKILNMQVDKSINQSACCSVAWPRGEEEKKTTTTRKGGEICILNNFCSWKETLHMWLTRWSNDKGASNWTPTFCAGCESRGTAQFFKADGVWATNKSGFETLKSNLFKCIWCWISDKAG